MQAVRSHLWLAFTQMAEPATPPRTFVAGQGTTLVDADGQRVFDAISSVWTTIHGHCHPAIAERIAAQARRLDHATLLGAKSDVAEELASRLAELVGLDRVFFASDGASAVELALKIAVQYWQNLGQPQRTRFVKLVDAYHGDTTGAMSVSDIGLFRARFAPLMFESVTYGGERTVIDAPDVAAIVVEPVVQAAAGMRIVPQSLYAGLRERSTLLIVDEIATGFGRTGPMFASAPLALAPDLLCLGKGLTGGTLALSATLASEHVYAAFSGAFAEQKHLFHGHSYSGNPLACAAALASLDLFEAEGTLAHAAELARGLEAPLAELARHPAVTGVRRAGLMCAIALDANAVDRRDAPTAAWRIANDLYGRGYFTRPLGDAIQLVPPLSSSYEELASFCSAVGDLLDA